MGGRRRRHGHSSSATAASSSVPDAHDAEAKTVLGKKLPAGRGIEDGRDVLALVAHHPSTARHLATKIAARFVADEPPPALVDRLAQTFLSTGGDLREVMRALAYSPEFWSRDARGSKIKSPFEVAVSAARALAAEVTVPRLSPLMDVQRPRRTGNAGAARVDQSHGPAALRLPGADRVPRSRRGLGVDRVAAHAHELRPSPRDRSQSPASTVDLGALNGGREPESPEDALAVYAALVLPERESKRRSSVSRRWCAIPRSAGASSARRRKSTVPRPPGSESMADADADADSMTDLEPPIEDEIESEQPAVAAASPAEMGGRERGRPDPRLARVPATMRTKR